MIKYFLFFVKTLPLSETFWDGKFVFSKTESLFGQDGWRQKKRKIGEQLQSLVGLHPTLNSAMRAGEY